MGSSVLNGTLFTTNYNELPSTNLVARVIVLIAFQVYVIDTVLQLATD